MNLEKESILTPEKVKDGQKLSESLYNEVKGLMKKSNIKLKGDVEIREVYIVDIEEKRVIPALICGYSAKTEFHSYDKENGVVETEMFYHAIDKDGNKYYEESDIFFHDEKIAKEFLCENLED